MIAKKIETILNEIRNVLKMTDQAQVERLAQGILKANRIVLCGAGRVGMACRGFAMRLTHLGKNAYMLGDATVPSIGSGDLLLIASGSGETQTIYDLAVIGKKAGAALAVVTGRPESRIGSLADTLLTIKAPSKVAAVTGMTSIQPMTTLNEQCLSLFFDALVLVLMEKTGQTDSDLKTRHSILE